MLLELENPLQQLLGAQLNVHLPSVTPLVFLARPAPAGIVAPQLSGRRLAAGAHCRAHRGGLSTLGGSVSAGRA